MQNTEQPALPPWVLTLRKWTSSMAIKNISDLYGPEYFKGNEYGLDLKREAMYRQEFDRVSRRAVVKKEARMLDIGCGIGSFTERFEKFEQFGVEISPYAIEKARARGITVYSTEEFVEGAIPGPFHLIIWRGTFQHLDEPMRVLKKCVDLLDGLLVFLATPNSNSPAYRKHKTLPALDPPRNFVIPADVMMVNILKNLGLKNIEVLYPYLGTPYARPAHDLIHHLFGSQADYAFPRSMMEVYAWSGE